MSWLDYQDERKSSARCARCARAGRVVDGEVGTERCERCAGRQGQVGLGDERTGRVAVGIDFVRTAGSVLL